MAHVSLVTLGVDHLDFMTRFYEAMGWCRSTASIHGTVTFLTGGAIVLSLFGREDLAADAGIPASSGGGTSVALAMNVTSEGAVDQALAAAAAAGGTITKATRRTEWGGYSGYCADPDGHLWEVAYNPGFVLQEGGRGQPPDE